MATIFKPKGRDGFVVKYRRFGRQYWKRFDTRDEAKRHLAEVLQYSDRVKPDCDPKICVSDYSRKWLDVVRVNASPRTVQYGYRVPSSSSTPISATSVRISSSTGAFVVLAARSQASCTAANIGFGIDPLASFSITSAFSVASSI